jgi:hypothetical protein
VQIPRATSGQGGSIREKKFVYNLHNAQVIYSGIKNVGIDMVIYVPETWA